MDIKRNPADRRNKKVKIILLVILALISVIFVFSYDYHKFTVKNSDIRLGKVERSVFKVEVVGSGTLEPKHTSTQVARNGGIIKQVLVAPGQKVIQGQPLMILDNATVDSSFLQANSDLAIQIAQSESDKFELAQQATNYKIALMLAESDFELAKLQLEARSDLLNKKAAPVSKLEYEAYAIGLKNADAKVKGARETVEAFKLKHKAKSDEINVLLASKLNAKNQAQKQAEELTIKSSIDGVVQDINVNLGQYIKAGETAVKIVDTSSLRAVVQIPAFDSNKLKPGLQSELMIGEKRFNGKVEKINPDVKGNVVEVDIAIDELTTDFKIGSYVKSTIMIDQRDGVISVSKPRNIAEFSTADVLVVNGKLAKRRNVRFGAMSSTRVEILSGLNPGEEIILSNTEDIPKSSEEIVIN